MKEDIRMRQKWLELYVETGSVTKTALRCGITRSTLYRWINCEKEQGKSNCPISLNVHQDLPI
ncbi:helix-turn-helix domain-containing protein [Bacteroides ovatus]|nr:helix-turn-helix domain-containing protein [Bacteroides ovatus]KAA3947057.1 helix-turn-helix domain-containing protein [Bacteroides ovatus]KAA3959150.1 helix-turn-helix domain-containing protein [Bacteroides ovatus]KAA3963967.1 helix-turn-helix domain-containing protein [Bacteroides ovatus]KAA4002167.1 helix-turn-helix domain-containing protein [Bacteroides ovatus]